MNTAKNFKDYVNLRKTQSLKIQGDKILSRQKISNNQLKSAPLNELCTTPSKKTEDNFVNNSFRVTNKFKVLFKTIYTQPENALRQFQQKTNRNNNKNALSLRNDQFEKQSQQYSKSDLDIFKNIATPNQNYLQTHTAPLHRILPQTPQKSIKKSRVLKTQYISSNNHQEQTERSSYILLSESRAETANFTTTRQDLNKNTAFQQQWLPFLPRRQIHTQPELSARSLTQEERKNRKYLRKEYRVKANYQVPPNENISQQRILRIILRPNQQSTSILHTAPQIEEVQNQEDTKSLISRVGSRTSRSRSSQNNQQGQQQDSQRLIVAKIKQSQYQKQFNLSTKSPRKLGASIIESPSASLHESPPLSSHSSQRSYNSAMQAPLQQAMTQLLKDNAIKSTKNLDDVSRKSQQNIKNFSSVGVIPAQTKLLTPLQKRKQNEQLKRSSLSQQMFQRRIEEQQVAAQQIPEIKSAPNLQAEFDFIFKSIAESVGSTSGAETICFANLVRHFVVQQRKTISLEIFLQHKISRDSIEKLTNTFANTLQKNGYIHDFIDGAVKQIRENAWVIANGELLEELCGQGTLLGIVSVTLDKASFFYKFFGRSELRAISYDRVKAHVQQHLVLLMQLQQQNTGGDTISQSSLKQKQELCLQQQKLMRTAHQKILLSFDEFFLLKILLYETMRKDLSADAALTLRFLQLVESVRYEVQIEEHFQLLSNDEQLINGLVEKLCWGGSVQASTIRASSEELLKSLCRCLVEQVVFRRTVSNVQESPLQLLKKSRLTASAFDDLSNRLCAELKTHARAGKQLISDAFLRLQRLKIRAGLAPASQFCAKGQQSFLTGIEKLVHQVEVEGSASEDLSHFLAARREEQCNFAWNFKSEQFARSGLLVLEYLLVQMLTSEDLHAPQDCRAGIAAFLISNQTVAYWKTLLERAASQLHYSKSAQSELITTFTQQMENIFDTAEERHIFLNL